MKIEIDKKRLFDFYNKADAAGKHLLCEVFGETTFEFDYHEVKSYEDACEVLGIEPIDFEEMNDVLDNNNFPMLEPHEIAYKKLTTIAKSLNFGWAPNWANFDEVKHNFVCRIAKDKRREIGVDIDISDAGCCIGLSNKMFCAGLFACRNRETALYFGKQFKNLWEEFLLPKRDVL